MATWASVTEGREETDGKSQVCLLSLEPSYFHWPTNTIIQKMVQDGGPPPQQYPPTQPFGSLN